MYQCYVQNAAAATVFNPFAPMNGNVSGSQMEIQTNNQSHTDASYGGGVPQPSDNSHNKSAAAA